MFCWECIEHKRLPNQFYSFIHNTTGQCIMMVFIYTHEKKLIMCIGKRWCVSVFYFCFSFKCIYTFLLLFCVVIYLYFVMLHVCLMYSVFIYSIRHESIGGISLVVDDIDAWLYSNSRLFSAFAWKTRRKMSGKWNVWTASDAVELFSNIFNFIFVL